MSPWVFLADGVDIVDCSKDVDAESRDFQHFMEHLERGIRHFNITDIQEAIEDFEAAVKSAAATKAACKAVSTEIKANVHAIVAALKQIKGPKDFVIHVIDNLFSNAENIFTNLSEAGRAYRTAEYRDSGRQLGHVFRMMLVGNAGPNTTETASLLV